MMKSKINPTILILTLIFFAISCSDSPFSPPGEKNPPPGSTTIFGLVEVTISGIGTDTMSAVARPARPDVAYNLTRPSGSGGTNDGTIQLEPISNGSFTEGVRGSGGVRYLYATFRVRNAASDGSPYPTPRQNLTFLAVDTDASAAAPETYSATSISGLRLFDGTSLTGTTAQAIAVNAIPTGQVHNTFGEISPSAADVLQTFTEANVAAITNVPAGVDVFPYGFITRSPEVTPGSRTLPANPALTQYDGLVTFAYKIPLQAQANQDPFEISVLFLPLDDTETRITQSPQEQNPRGNALLAARVAALVPDAVTIFPGSGYQGMAELRCGLVRVVGTVASPAAHLFPPIPAFTGLTPDPYAVGASNMAAATAFSAGFSGSVNGADARSFVVHGRQSGTQFINQAYSGNGTNTITAPAGSFYPGEQVEVSLTPGLGICPGTVARYRVAATAGSGSFGAAIPFGTEQIPTSVALGDLDGNGALDIAVANNNSNNVSVLAGDGAGGFSAVIGSPFGVGADPQSIALGDLDGDGNLDMATANNNSSNVSVLLGDGNGGFIPAANSPFTVGTEPVWVELGDLNGDGDLDMAVSNFGPNTISVLLNSGEGDFYEGPGSPIIVGSNPQRLAMGDLDGDGALDIVVANENSNDVSVLLGDGNGGFTPAPNNPFAVDTGPQSVVTGHLNGDGFLDLVVVNTASGNISVLLGNGPGSFTEASGSPISVGDAPRSAVLGDLNADGILDMAIAINSLESSIDSLRVLLGNGDGTFSATGVLYPVGAFTFSIAFGDFNEDNALDIVTANAFSNNITVLLNQ